MKSVEEMRLLFLKPLLAVEEAACLTGIGEHTIRELLADPSCDFALYLGTRVKIKRERFVEFLLQVDKIF